MEITLTKSDISEYDTGGGTREVEAVITIDSKLSPRLQRQVAIYETLGCMLGYALTHEQLETITDTLGDVLDQLG